MGAPEVMCPTVVTASMRAAEFVLDDTPGRLHPCCEHPRDQTHKRPVGHAFSEDSAHLRMGYRVEKPGEIEIGNPVDGASHALLVQATQGVVTAPPWSESVGGLEEKRFVDGFQNPAGHLLDDFIFRTADSQRSGGAILFGNLHP